MMMGLTKRPVGREQVKPPPAATYLACNKPNPIPGRRRNHGPLAGAEMTTNNHQVCMGRSSTHPNPPSHPPPQSQPGGEEDGLSRELWQACAGPLVYVPKVGDYVYYFLQGHIQQVKACIDQDCDMVIPPAASSVPSKLLCRVVDLQRKAEAVTDEVFARIVLLPVLEEKEQHPPDGEVISSNSWKEQAEEEEEDGGGGSSSSSSYSWNNSTGGSQMGMLIRKNTNGKRSFSKKLTPSDTSKHGGFSVPRRQAEDCLPPLNMSEEPPVQEIAAKDIHGNLWRFRHIYRGDPKRHLLTSGWSTFATSKRISPGDQFIFVRGESGELRVGVRRGGRQLQQKKPPTATVISANCMLHGILADACHAVANSSTFVVYYRPWSNSSEFIVPAGRYLKSAKIDYSPGTKFRMLFEGDECTEQRIERFEGTIVGCDPVDPLHWHDSEWESLKVKWDATSDTLARPQRVSPWNIDPIDPVKLTEASHHHVKRNRDFLFNTAMNAYPDFKGNFIGMLRNPFLLQSLNLEAFQDPRNNNGKKKSKTEEHDDPKPPIVIPHWLKLYSAPPMNSNLPLNFPIIPTNDIDHNNKSSQGQGQGQGKCDEAGWTRTVQDGPSPTVAAGVKSSWLGPPGDKYYSSSSSSSQQQEERKEDANEALLASPPLLEAGDRKCMVFGVNILSNNTKTEFPSPQIVTIDDVSEAAADAAAAAEAAECLSDSVVVPLTSQHSSGVSETLSYKPTGTTAAPDQQQQQHHHHGTDHAQSKNCCIDGTNPNGNCIIKVLKQGSQLGRMVDLAEFNGHEQLVRELDRMFGFRGGLIDGSGGWHVTFVDAVDGHQDGREIMFPIADREWHQLMSVAHKMYICPTESN